MISKKIEKLLNEQLNKEIFSANMYLAVCSYFKNEELDGFANFFRVQSKEELAHADKFFDFIHDVGGVVDMLPVEAPKLKIKSLVHAFEVTLQHEEYVTKSINTIIKAALAESDYATHAFLQWFVTEQVEEEALFNNLLKKLKMVGDNSSALYLLNNELRQRSMANAGGGR